MHGSEATGFLGAEDGSGDNPESFAIGFRRLMHEESSPAACADPNDIDTRARVIKLERQKAGIANGGCDVKKVALIAALMLLNFAAFAAGSKESLSDKESLEEMEKLKAGQRPVVQAPATGLFEIAARGTLQQVQAELQKGEDVNPIDADGKTALMHAAGSNPDPRVVRALLSAGADIESVDVNGDSALIWAARSGRTPEVIITLLKAGADAREKDFLGKKALAYAAANISLLNTDAYRQLEDASQ